ncbi:MAG: ribonuclease H-like domain-containing protein [Chloroflexi bacterium]|nr:ribonuclease H-like domain-containing protein [Chloroflexota bacterium]
MIRLFLDIETLPGDESLKQQIEGQITPPGNISRPERIEQWMQDERSQEVEKRYRATSLRGHAGRILCIGYLKETPQDVVEGVLTGDEADILRDFWTLAEDVDLFVGFNVLDFDLKFIVQRSIILGVRPGMDISFNRFRNDQVYDVMVEWDMGGRERISLDNLARAMVIESPKGDIDGSQVYDYFLAGRLQEIYDYCLRDVRATAEIYRRMNFM